MICKNCVAEITNDNSFCNACGTPVESSVPSNNAPQQPVYGAQQPVYTPYPPQTKIPGKGLGIAGMVLGIVGLVLFCIWYVGLPCSLVGLVLSGVSISKAKAVGIKNGMAVAGLVCSIVALGLDILGATLLAGTIGSLTSMF